MKKSLTVLALIFALLFIAACQPHVPSDVTEKNTDAVMTEESGRSDASPTALPQPSVTEAETSGQEGTVPEERVTFSVIGLKGPTGMGLAPLVTSAAEGQERFSVKFVVAGAPTEIVPMIVKGACDLAAIPANLASVLYNKTNGGIEVLAVNTLGVLNIVERGETVRSLGDLKGKTVYASGQGAVPEYVFNMLLEKNGLDPAGDLTIEWLSEHTEVVSKLASNPGSIALLPQPFVTVAQQNLEDLRLALDLNNDWERSMGDAGLIMGVLVARREVVAAHPEEIADFVRRYEASIAFVNEKTDEAAEMIETLDIFKAAIAKKAIPFCNIRFMTGDAMKTSLSGFLKLLHGVDAKAVGGKLPADDFYFSASGGSGNSGK